MFVEVVHVVVVVVDDDDGPGLSPTSAPASARVDLRMPGTSGLTVVEGLAVIDAATRVVVLTGWGSVPTAVEAMEKTGVQRRAGAVDV